jgi:nitrogen regulatory protein P-II 1
MKLVVFVLNREELLGQVMQAYVEAGVRGATVVDSEGMGWILTHEVPLFAGFQDFMKGNRPRNKTILSVVDGDETANRLEELLERVCGESPGTGVLFAVPVERFKVIGGGKA